MSCACLNLGHRQRAIAYDSTRVDALVQAALPLCTAVSRRLGGPLASCANIDVSVIGTRAMARVHRTFLNIPGATDVITFPYGEILVCAPVAAARAGEFQHALTDEIALYIIHGLLHLAGHDDIDPQGSARMAREQERILRAASGLIRK